MSPASRTSSSGRGVILLATVCYAVGPMIVKRSFSDVNPIGPVAAALGISTVMLAPAGIAAIPGAEATAGALASIVVLGVACSALALMLFFALIAEVGPSKASVITYVNPAVAVILGVALLDESLGAAAIAGLLLIIAGSWLSTGGRMPPGLAAIVTRRRGERPSPGAIVRHSAAAGLGALLLVSLLSGSRAEAGPIAPPQCEPEGATMLQGTPVTLQLTCTGNPETYQLATLPAHGTYAIFNDSATFAYQSDPGFSGTDSFTYTATNAGGTSLPAEITMTVVAGPAPSSEFVIGKPLRDREKGTALLPVTVEAPGTLVLSGRRVKPIETVRPVPRLHDAHGEGRPARPSASCGEPDGHG